MERGAVRASLQKTFAGYRACLVLAHDNPDPDALASAFAFQAVLQQTLGIEARVGFGGVIGRAENRAMIKVLGLTPEPLSTLDLAQFDGCALVDAQPSTGNSSLPASLPLLAIVDHHPPRTPAQDVPHRDIRPGYGATATLMTEYAVSCGVQLSSQLATALFYAIRSETQDLGRESSEADRLAYFYLLERADMRAVADIQRARVPMEYFRAFRTAIDRAEVVGNVVFSELGTVGAADIVAEIADFLLRLQEAEWAFCIGRHQNDLIVSLRTSDPDAHAGKLIREAIAGLGTAGGHGTMAGGQVPLSESTYLEAASQLRRRVLDALSVDEQAARPLLT